MKKVAASQFHENFGEHIGCTPLVCISQSAKVLRGGAFSIPGWLSFPPNASSPVTNSRSEVQPDRAANIMVT